MSNDAFFPITRRGVVLGGAMAATLAARPALAGVLPRVFKLAAVGSRQVQITEWLPRGKPVGTILFSHGAASSPGRYDVLLRPMVEAGWRILAPLHVDSLDHPDTAKYAGLASWKARLEDFQALTAHIGHAPYVAVGHSYGGLTALVLGGAQSVPPPGWQGPQSDGKALAVIAFSPPPVIPVLITMEGYANVSVPSLIQTGTADILPQKGTTDPDSWKKHLDAYEAAPARGDRYGLVLAGVTHYFGGLICDFAQPGPPAVQGAKDASRVAGLFLQAFGCGEPRGRARLNALVSDSLPVRLMRK